MIDVSTETTIPLSEVPKHIPARNGRRVHRATVWRWAADGVRGVTLETVKIGGATYTSTEAIARFAAACSAADDPGERTAYPTPAAVERADRELTAMGI